MKNESKDSVVYKAGGVVVNDNIPNCAVMIYRSKFKNWSFPKGHVEPGETYEETAVRELKEETGLDVYILSDLPYMEYRNSDEGNIRLMMYLMKTDVSIFQKENVEDLLEWVPLSQIIEKASHDNLKRYFKKILPTLEEYFKASK